MKPDPPKSCRTSICQPHDSEQSCQTVEELSQICIMLAAHPTPLAAGESTTLGVISFEMYRGTLAAGGEISYHRSEKRVPERPKQKQSKTHRDHKGSSFARDFSCKERSQLLIRVAYLIYLFLRYEG